MNILPIILAATAAFVSAFLWNGPVFGKLGRRLSGVTLAPGEQPQFKVSQIVLNYLVFLVTAAVMSIVFWLAFTSSVNGERTWFRGLIMAWWIWLGFTVTATSVDVIWKGKSWKLWLYECASAFVAMGIMGAVLGSY